MLDAPRIAIKTALSTQHLFLPLLETPNCRLLCLRSVHLLMYYNTGNFSNKLSCTVSQSASEILSTSDELRRNQHDSSHSPNSFSILRLDSIHIIYYKIGDFHIKWYTGKSQRKKDILSFLKQVISECLDDQVTSFHDPFIGCSSGRRDTKSSLLKKIVIHLFAS